MNAASFSSICSRYIFILASLTLVLAFPTRIQFSPKKIRRKVLISHEVLLLSSSPLSLSHFEHTHTHPPPLFPGRLWHSRPETGTRVQRWDFVRRMIQGSGFSTHPGSLLLVPTYVFLALVFISIWLTVDVFGSLG
ncbi:unnamed protein product [Rangifer tarandus platyrhynchus]|uniref:Uncharacterized protein n=1 Tax=Rangifer tarandus platyrhynchus TaxID=3082113 RepID=A0ABN8YNH3_RANTA|nr:unnamed protein product [Rangifer tarandus platyrhynchus]